MVAVFRCESNALCSATIRGAESQGRTMLVVWCSRCLVAMCKGTALRYEICGREWEGGRRQAHGAGFHHCRRVRAREDAAECRYDDGIPCLLDVCDAVVQSSLLPAVEGLDNVSRCTASNSSRCSASCDGSTRDAISPLTRLLVAPLHPMDGPRYLARARRENGSCIVLAKPRQVCTSSRKFR